MAVFEAPGPGYWELDRSHFDSGVSPISEELSGDAVRTAFQDLFRRRGMPVHGIEMASVNGFVY